MDSLDDILNDQQVERRHRRSMPQHYVNEMAYSRPQYGISAINIDDMAAKNRVDIDSALGDFQFSPVKPTTFSVFDISCLDMYIQLDSQLTNDNIYSATSPHWMGSMISSSSADRNTRFTSEGASVERHISFPVNATSEALIDMDARVSWNPTETWAQDFSMDMNPVRTAGTMNNAEKDILYHQQHTRSKPVSTEVQSDSFSIDNKSCGLNNRLAPSLLVPSPGSIVSLQRGNTPIVVQQSSASDSVTSATTTTGYRNKENIFDYLTSEFDVVKALWLVTTRKDPQIDLGPVDLSCAFVICEVDMDDCPIVHVSDNFQRLTGYSRHEVISQNCRFLQAPSGNVEAGSKREFTDDSTLYHLKKMIHQGLEVQQSIINYRKDGKPFLNLLTLIPISWDTKDIRYFIGFQVDIAEHPETKSGQDWDNLNISYILSHISQSIWTPTTSGQWGLERGQTLDIDDGSTLFPNPHPEGPVSDLHGQLCNKMLFGTTGHVVHVLSSKGIFLYLSPACKQVLEYSVTELVGQSLSFVCHPYDIVPVTRELKNTATGNPVNVTFRIRRKNSGYTWFESYGSLLSEKSNGRKCILLVGRKRPVFSLSRQNLEANGGISDSELWTKISISGMFLFVSSNIKALLGWQPETLIGTSMQDLMRKKSWLGFRRSIEQASKDKIVACKHEVKNRRNQVLQARTTFYPGDVVDGRNPSFLLAQTQLIKASTRKIASTNSTESGSGVTMPKSSSHVCVTGLVPHPAVGVLSSGVHDIALASKDNLFDELRPTKSSNWQFELRQLEKNNRILVEELGKLLANKKKHKKRKRVGNIMRGCANCHTQNTPEWRRGPSGQRDLCNSCGLRSAKQAKNLL